jgi:hypothetical protein
MGPGVKRILVVGAIAAAFIAGLIGFAVKGAVPNVGQHIHVEVANHPVDGHPIPRAPWTFQVTVKLHNQTGKATYLRIDDSSTTRVKVPLNLGPCADCQVSFPLTVDFSQWPVGRRELRWHVDVPHNADGNRQFTTARDQVCNGSCSPNGPDGRPTPFNGGGSWYLSQYATVYDLSPDTQLRPGGSITFRAAQSASRACAFLNPDFHNGSSGTVLGCWSDTSKHAVTIPASAVAGDRLVLFASQADGNAGLIRLLVGTGADRATTDYEFQSWWAKGGVVLP